MPTATIRVAAALLPLLAFAGAVASAEAQPIGPSPFPLEKTPQPRPPQKGMTLPAPPQKGVTIPAPLPAGKLGLRVFTLRNADATKVAKVLTDFLGEPNRPLVISVYGETKTLMAHPRPPERGIAAPLI